MSHMPREHEALARRPRRHQRHGSHQADNNPVASNKREAAERNKAEELSQLFRLGWKKSPNMMRARAICEGRVILDQAHITDSLIFLGNIIIIEALKCEGFMGFSGTLDLWGNPAVVKNLVVDDSYDNIINGDVIVTSTAYFIGNCDIKGTLTVVGILAVSKTVTCKNLIVTGMMTKLSNSARIETPKYVFNGRDEAGDGIVHLRDSIHYKVEGS